MVDHAAFEALLTKRSIALSHAKDLYWDLQRGIIPPKLESLAAEDLDALIWENPILREQIRKALLQLQAAFDFSANKELPSSGKVFEWLNEGYRALGARDADRSVDLSNLPDVIDQMLKTMDAAGWGKSERGRPARMPINGAAQIYLQHLASNGVRITSTATISSNSDHPRFRDGHLYSEAILGLYDFLKEIDQNCSITYNTCRGLLQDFSETR
ncbi:MAG: hypothetical protein AB8B88_04445, partial [Devosiaceae bacterium]